MKLDQIIKLFKNLAKDCLSNIKLLCFIPLNNFKTFYKLILDKYRCKFPSFFKYFDKNYIKGRVLDKKQWNYNNIITNNLNNDILFYTNNIVESFNNNLNKKFIGFAKTMHNFKNALNDVINLYEMSDAYKEKRLSITRALAHYVNNQNEFDLINSKDIVKIKENYKRHLISNKLPIDENDDNKSEESDYYIKKKENNFFSSESESESSENIISNSINSLSDNSDDDDEDDDGNNDFIGKANNKKSKITKNNNQKEEKNDEKEKGKKTRNKNKKHIIDFNNSMSSFGQNFCIKKFKDDDYNNGDIIMIYNDKIGIDENHENFLDKGGLFELELKESLKKDFYDNKLKLRKLKINEILNKLRKININNN